MIYKWIAICGVHIAESLMNLDVFIVLVGRNFVFGICKLKPKTLKKLLKIDNLKNLET